MLFCFSLFLMIYARPPSNHTSQESLEDTSYARLQKKNEKSVPPPPTLAISLRPPSTHPPDLMLYHRSRKLMNRTRQTIGYSVCTWSRTTVSRRIRHHRAGAEGGEQRDVTRGEGVHRGTSINLRDKLKSAHIVREAGLHGMSRNKDK